MSDPGSGASPALVGVALADVFEAREMLLAVERLQHYGSLRLQDAVIVAKDAEGSVRVVETRDPQPGSAAASGAMWAGLLGLLFGGPIGWIAGLGVGAGAGAAFAKVIDIGVPDEWVDWFRLAVEPGSVALVLLLGDLVPEALGGELARFEGSHVIETTLGPAALAALVEAAAHASADATVDAAAPADDPSTTSSSTAPPEPPGG